MGTIVTTSISYEKSIYKRIRPKIGIAKKFKSPTILYIKLYKNLSGTKRKNPEIKHQKYAYNHRLLV